LNKIPEAKEGRKGVLLDEERQLFIKRHGVFRRRPKF